MITAARGLAAALGMSLVPFGPVTKLSSLQSGWHGFAAEDPVLLVARAQKVKTHDCAGWVKALQKETPGLPHSDDSYAGWKPWSEDDLEAVSSCDGFPCAVKLDKPETEKMAAVPEDARFKKFLALVSARVSGYEKTQERREYEFPGAPVDPWAFFEKHGFKTGLKRPTEPVLRDRKLELDPGKIVIRQVLDRRMAKSKSGREAAVWIRDAYTDHFFDSWGEWADVSCSGGEVTVIQALMVELDLLKKNDLISKISRGKMRSAVEHEGQNILDHWFQELLPRQ